VAQETGGLKCGIEGHRSNEKDRSVN
jgi:hypothetical protein